MSETDIYRTISKASAGLYREKGSRFLASAFPVSHEEEIKQILEDIRKEHHEARHHCYAWILGPGRERWRANDDGEPSGTGGRPILGQINSAGLTNILVVVTRYFGGTLLGVSGLGNAYKTAAAQALSAAEIISQTVSESYEIVFPYSAMNDIMKILKEEEAGHSSHDFDLECRLTAEIRVSGRQRFLERLSRIDGVSHRLISEDGTQGPRKSC
jgi:uncharacterized YigZ family protein